MERVNALINKLQERTEQHADADELLALVQQLQSELVRQISAPARTMSTAKVAVMMPSGNRMAVAANDDYAPVAKADKNYQPVAARKEEPTPTAWLYDPLKEIPTLAHQDQPKKELNDIIGAQQASLNDRLKIERTELADLLTEAPFKDLKKAIGINDRYVFVNELFRGDEAMYERSIKTINAFRILPEAEYWMERELKVKLAWDDGKTTTQHFYQLVKRRFS
ncbi:MAG TPA: hypothetical protein VGM41_17600 [Chitinophagaceae bacterium]|jgi:hypothetical protein